MPSSHFKQSLKIKKKGKQHSVQLLQSSYDIPLLYPTPAWSQFAAIFPLSPHHASKLCYRVWLFSSLLHLPIQPHRVPVPLLPQLLKSNLTTDSCSFSERWCRAMAAFSFEPDFQSLLSKHSKKWLKLLASSTTKNSTFLRTLCWAH